MSIDLKKAPGSLDIGSATGIEGSSPQHQAVIQSAIDFLKKFEMDLTYRYVSALPGRESLLIDRGCPPGMARQSATRVIRNRTKPASTLARGVGPGIPGLLSQSEEAHTSDLHGAGRHITCVEPRELLVTLKSAVTWRIGGGLIRNKADWRV